MRNGRSDSPEQAEAQSADQWKRGFLDRLRDAQSCWVREFEDALDACVAPVFEELSAFLRDNGFKTSMPLREPSRRSFKFEVAENAYVLALFAFRGVGEFDCAWECIAPQAQPHSSRSTLRLADLSEQWARAQFQQALDRLVDTLAGAAKRAPAPAAA